MNQLYLSANHVSHRNAPAYLQALRHYGVTHLIAYPSPLAVLAQTFCELQCDASLRIVVSNAEPFFPWQREIIRRGLHCDVRETYGMVELAAAASECDAGTLHQWPEVGWIEVLDDEDTLVRPGSSGRFICTGLLNADMPLIRYEVGDRGRLPENLALCACGRGLHAIQSVDGRSSDLLIAPDGRRVFWLNPIFYGLPIREAQIVQEAMDRVRVRYVPGPEHSVATDSSIAQRLRARMGELDVTFERVDRIPRGPNGKFRPVICNLPGVESNRIGTT